MNKKEVVEFLSKYIKVEDVGDYTDSSKGLTLGWVVNKESLESKLGAPINGRGTTLEEQLNAIVGEKITRGKRRWNSFIKLVYPNTVFKVPTTDTLVLMADCSEWVFLKIVARELMINAEYTVECYES